MTRDSIEPEEEDNIECHLQQIGMGTLICRAAKQTGEGTTNEVNPYICFNCETGKVYREVGCDAILPKIQFFLYSEGALPQQESLLCKVRKRETSIEYCQTCSLVTAETTKQIVSTARGLFQSQGFYSAYKAIENARTSMRDGNFEGTITQSIACLESVMRICHEKLEEPLPEKKQLTELWKSTRGILLFNNIDETGSSSKLANSLSGIVAHLGGLRNALSDAHGRGLIPPEVSEAIAEFALNTSSTMATVIIRRFSQMHRKKE